jgi:cytochrome c553
MKAGAMLRKGLLLGVVVALSGFWAGVAAAAGDYDAGARKSIYCAYCHGYDGNPLDPSVPRLAGRKVEDIVARIKAIEDGNSMHPSMRQAFMTGDLGDQDVLDLATFFSRQPVRGK